jgi:hypothetical protein
MAKKKKSNFISGIAERIAVKSAIRVILTLTIGVFVGIKFPEGVDIACQVAETLDYQIDLCEK